ncbi:ankyrin-1-like [Daktulosphaira vitifoliae]|uniref:ankyrin-1-like n=1 Tax=Daktulosphaira vitifoliae TaxID=58002 RepID=UPI0021AA9C11|nr:ankyrin-1-like [Daktulosphaira vitifoliae]
MCVYYYRKRAGSTAFAPLDLRKAIERGHYDAVKRMITWNRYLMHCPSGRTADYPIHVAVQTGNQRIVKLLLNRGADPNVRNAHRKTPMHQCILHCRNHIIGLLVGHGADLDVTDGSNNTPLDLATLMNEKRCLDLMLNYEIPKGVLNKAFFKAASQDNTVLMNKLLNRGAEIEYRDEVTGFTALLMAMKSKHVRATQLLLEKGADPMVHDFFRWTCLHFAVYYQFPNRILVAIMQNCTKKLIDFKTCNQETALHLAAKRGNETAAFVLLRSGASVNGLDCRSRTPLLTALHWQNETVARFIIYSGANVNRVPGSIQTPLHAAVARNNLSLVQLMLEHGAKVVDLKNDDLDWTVIHSACETGDLNMLACLLEHSDPEMLAALHCGRRPKPPLLVAATRGHSGAVKALLARGVDINTRSKDNETVLHAAVRANNASLVELLLNAGACIDARNSLTASRPLDISVYTWGRRVTITAHLVHSDRMAKAVVRHDVDTVSFLLSCGVSPNMTTEAYGSPLHVAVRHRRYEMMATILSSDRSRTTIRHNGVTPLDYATDMGDTRAVKMLLWKNMRRSRHSSLIRTNAKKMTDNKKASRALPKQGDSPRRTSI